MAETTDAVAAASLAVTRKNLVRKENAHQRILLKLDESQPLKELKESWDKLETDYGQPEYEVGQGIIINLLRMGIPQTEIKELLRVGGSRINSLVRALKDPEFKHLYDTTDKIRERMSTFDSSQLEPKGAVQADNTAAGALAAGGASGNASAKVKRVSRSSGNVDISGILYAGGSSDSDDLESEYGSEDAEVTAVECLSSAMALGGMGTRRSKRKRSDSSPAFTAGDLEGAAALLEQR